MAEKYVKSTHVSSEEENLLKLVDENEQNLIDLLKNLVSIDSRSYSQDVFSDQAEIFAFIEKFMKNAGAECEYYKCPHPNSNKGENGDWLNLVSYREGKEKGKFLQYCGHVDVVPFTEEKWDEGLHPLKPVVRDGRIYGRGAADMKGGIAAQMMAFKLLQDAGIPIKGKFQLLLFPDEEINGNYGAQFMAREHKDVIDADGTIISESTAFPPITSPTIIVGEKGHLWLKIRVFGASGHGSMPKPKSNSINKATRLISNWKKIPFPKINAPISVITMIKSLLKRFSLKTILKFLFSSKDGEDADPYDEDGTGIGNFFKTTISFTKIKAGTKTNVIPDVCDLEVDIRLLPGIKKQSIMDSLTRYCTKLGYRVQLPENYKNIQKSNKKIQKRQIDVAIKEISATPGTFVDPNNPFSKLIGEAFENVYNRSIIYFFAPGATDAVHLREKGIRDVVVFGPTGGFAHDSNEYIEVEHLLKTCKVFLLLAYRMLCN